MRAKITAEKRNRVLLAFDDEEGVRRVCRFSAPSAGGYVCQIYRDGSGHQICERLYSTGATVSWSGRRPLVKLIRREWRRRCEQARRAGNKMEKR